MPMRCEDCIHNCFMRGAVRGVMDCDPDEWYCDANMDEFYFNEDDIEYDEETGEEIECPKYASGDAYYYDDRY